MQTRSGTNTALSTHYTTLPLTVTLRIIPVITVGMNYHVIPGRQQDFEDKFAAVINALRAADGHVESKLYRDVADPCAYLIVSEWSQQDRFIEFIRSEEFKAVTNWGKEQILTGRPSHKIYKTEQPQQ